MSGGYIIRMPDGRVLRKNASFGRPAKRVSAHCDGCGLRISGTRASVKKHLRDRPCRR